MSQANVSDLASLPLPTEECIIQTLRTRYENKFPYTLVGSVLLSVHTELDSAQELKNYHTQDEKNLPLDPAHLYLFLYKHYRRMHHHKESTSVILSGDTGSGKSTILRRTIDFMTAVDENLNTIFLAGHALITAMGSAKTEFNNHASRFALYTRLYFADNGTCTGGEFFQYGLEVSRVARLQEHQYNFNIFYDLLYGAPQGFLDLLQLQRDKPYRYLKSRGSDPMNIFQENYQSFQKAFAVFDDDVRHFQWLMRILAAILHLGNIQFTEANGKVSLSSNNTTEIKMVTKLLDLDSPQVLETALLFVPSKRTASIKQSEHTRDRFAMIIFSMVSSWVLEKVNGLVRECYLPNQMFFGMLDMFGSHFTPAPVGLEEFLINFANEKLRKTFFYMWFENSPVDFQDTFSSLTLGEAFFQILQNECAPGIVNEQQFYDRVQQLCQVAQMGQLSNADKPSLTLEIASRRSVYQLAQWWDLVHMASEETVSHLLKVCKNSSINQCLAFVDPIRVHRMVTGTLFTGRLQSMLHFVNQSKLQFIHCINPNSSQPGSFSEDLVLAQIKYYGIPELVDISHYQHVPPLVLPADNNSRFPGEEVSPRGGHPHPKRNKHKAARRSSHKSKKLFPDKLFKSSPRHENQDPADQGDLPSPTSGSKPRGRRSDGDASLSPRRSRSKSIKHLVSRSVTKGMRLAQEDAQPVSRRGVTQTSSSYSTKSALKDLSSEPEPIKRNNSDMVNLRMDDEFDDSTEEDSLVLSEDQLSELSDADDSSTAHGPSLALNSLYSSSSQPNLLELIGHCKYQSSANPSDCRKLQIQQKLGPEELMKRKEEFLFLYSCGSLLRTIYQQDESPISSKRASIPRLESSDIPDSDENFFAANGPHVSARRVVSSMTEDDETDDEPAEPPDDPEDGMTPELRKWIKDAAVKLQQRAIPRLKLDTADSVVNQINHSSTIRTTPRRQKSVITFVTDSGQLLFQTYAEGHFSFPAKMQKLKKTSTKYKSKLKKLTSATRVPISTPLHKIRQNTLAQLAVENFHWVLAYMLSKPEAVSFSYATAIIRNGLEKSSLRDEIYCQLVKQATNNLKERWEIRIWELMAFCTGCFAPSPYFYKYLVKFFEDTAAQSGEIGAWASYCKDRLAKTTDQGKRLFVPTERELTAVCQRKPIIQVFYFVDGKQKQIPIYSSTTASEGLEFLMQMIGLKNQKGYMVYECYKVYDKRTLSENVVERSLLYSEILCNSLSKFEEFRAAYQSKPYITLDTSFLIKRKLFPDPSVAIVPVEVPLLYNQITVMVRSAELLVKEQDALILAALDRQVKQGNFSPDRRYNAKELMPVNIRHHRVEKEWKTLLDARWKDLEGTSVEEARDKYLQYCFQLPFYGYHLFPVAHYSEWKMPADVFIGVNYNGIYFMSADKEIYYSFSYLELRSHTSTPYVLKLSFDNNLSIEVKSDKGDEIVSLIIDYKFLELSKED